MSLQQAMTARQRFYEILVAAAVPELDAVRVHVGLAALLSTSYQFDLGQRGMQPSSRRGGRSVVLAADPTSPPPRWLPDHLHYNYLLQRAPQDLATQLDLASTLVKAEAPVPHLFFGYASLGLVSAQWLEAMRLMGEMYPKMMEGLRSFVPVADDAPAAPPQRMLGW